MPNFGQGNYAAAKLGIVALSSVLALEGETVGVRSNVVVPSARTQTVLDSMASAGELIEPADETGFDYWDPGNVSPVVGWLASPTCRATGQVLHAVGNEVRLFAPPPSSTGSPRAGAGPWKSWNGRSVRNSARGRT